MPIGDLLASISGQPAASSPGPAKRKAEDDIKPVPKVARKTPPPTKPQPTRPLDRPNGSASYNGTSRLSSNGSSKPSNGNGVKDTLKPINGTNRVSKPTPPVRPTQVTNGGATRVAPKKGSFAEILARANKAQQSMGQVGKIQHKKVEKKELPPKVEPRAPVGKRPVGASGYHGTSKPGARPPTNGRNAAPSNDPRGRPLGNGRPTSGKTAAQEEHEKKIKKAAVATTGYTGTARPAKPSATPSRKSAPSRGGALLNQPVRHSRNYKDEYDEELDDFIEYDDDEDDPRLGGGRAMEYDSDGSSDMEGGFDDLELEDRRAEMIARREDIEEERLEKKHKAEKEERKRRYLEQMRAKGR